MEAKEVNEYLELVERRTQILVESGISWKPEFEQELESIDKRLAVLRRKVEEEHGRGNRKWYVMQEAEKEGIREYLQDALHFLEENRCRPYMMNNASLAGLIFASIKKIYPNAVMVNYAGGQCMAVFVRQKMNIAERIREVIARRMEEITEMQEALEALQRTKGC